MTKTNVPRLRFMEFNGEWNKKFLKDIAVKEKNKNSNEDYKDVFTNSARYGVVEQKEFFDKSIANESNISGYYIVKTNDFVYNPRISVNAKFGPINRNKLNKAGVVSPLYFVFKIEDMDLNFIDFFFKGSKWHQYVYKNGNSGARSDRVSISDSDFMAMPISFPFKDEQKKIGFFFENLDKVIEFQTQKLEQLKKLKQGYLQKMFPQDGESLPRLRFSGFSSEWNSFRLGEVSTFSNGVTGDINLHDSKYRITRIETISDGIVDENKLGFVGNNPGESKLLKKGDILFSNINSISHIGKTAIFNSNSKIYHGINLTRISVNDGNDPYFVNYLLNTRKYKIWFKRHANQAVSQASINNKDLSKVIIFLPEYKEQKKISMFFLKLDQMINDQSDKINELKQQKKAYLQKMFV